MRRRRRAGLWPMGLGGLMSPLGLGSGRGMLSPLSDVDYELQRVLNGESALDRRRRVDIIFVGFVDSFS